MGLGIPGKANSRELWALRDVSFEVEPGTILGIIGPNGAGKTTLLKVLARITVPTEGRVVGRGRVVSLLEVGTGFQGDLTGRENIFINAAMYGIPRSEVLEKLDQIIDFAGVREFIDTPLKHYSSGMYLRLAFSVAVNMEPDILLADEVLAVGDLDFQERCLERVRQAGEAGMTVLFVSHDMAAITRLSQKVLWLNAGQIVECGATEKVVAHYQESAWALLSTQKKARTGNHANEYGEIVSVRLTSASGQEIGAVRVSEDSFIRMNFRAFQGGLAVRCALDVYTRGIHALRTVHPRELTLPAPGNYRALLRIPAHLLSETTYSLNASITLLKDGAQHPLVEYNALTFQVYDTDADRSARGTYQGRLQGVLTPRLDWELGEEPDAIRA
ncbi:MAG: polysaccharide ABC transporter ATP-binding protein [Planctomycetota bacterium]